MQAVGQEAFSLSVLLQSTYNSAWNIVGAQQIFVNYMYDHVMEGSIFCLVHGFHLCSHSEPYSSLLTTG